MSRKTKKRVGWFTGCVTVIGLLVTFFALAFQEPVVTREIHLVAKEMAFFLDGENLQNPTLSLQTGEKIRFVFRNLDVGIDHDLVFPQWEITTGKIPYGGSFVMTVRPRERGESFYLCSLHPAMMKGVVIVTDE